MQCFAGWTPEQVLHVAYHLVVFGGGGLFILWQAVGISRIKYNPR